MSGPVFVSVPITSNTGWHCKLKPGKIFDRIFERLTGKRPLKVREIVSKMKNCVTEFAKYSEKFLPTVFHYCHITVEKGILLKNILTSNMIYCDFSI